MAKNEHTVLRSAIWASMGVMVTTILLYFSAAFVQSVNPDLVPSESMIWAAQNMMPTLIGVVLLAGILAAGVSSASTFLSLIGFSLTNDILRSYTDDEKKRLRISRIGMFCASIVILAVAYINPPQIFVIMYFGGTVIASSWGPVALASIWSRKLSKTGGFLGMLFGFLTCVVVKIGSGMYSGDWPIYLDSFILGIAASVLGMVIGSKINPVTQEECSERELMFITPAREKNTKDITKTKRSGYYYIAFGLLVFAFFMVAWALPYMNIL